MFYIFPRAHTTGILVLGSRAGESCSEARGNISFEGPIGPENTSGGGGGGGVPLEIGPPGPLLYLGAPIIPWGPG